MNRTDRTNRTYRTNRNTGKTGNGRDGLDGPDGRMAGAMLPVLFFAPWEGWVRQEQRDGAGPVGFWSAPYAPDAPYRFDKTSFRFLKVCTSAPDAPGRFQNIYF